MTEHRLIIYERIKELKAEIDRYLAYMDIDKDNEKYYEKKIADLRDLKNFNEAIYYRTYKVQ